MSKVVYKLGGKEVEAKVKAYVVTTKDYAEAIGGKEPKGGVYNKIKSAKLYKALDCFESPEEIIEVIESLPIEDYEEISPEVKLAIDYAERFDVLEEEAIFVLEEDITEETEYLLYYPPQKFYAALYYAAEQEGEVDPRAIERLYRSL
jgi:hypothetical protein